MNRLANAGELTVGFAIVGCGMIARFHARALAEVPARASSPWSAASPPTPQKLADELGLDCDIYDRPGAGAGPAGRGRRHRDHAQRRPPGAGRRRRRRPASTSSSRSRWKSPPSAATASSTPATRNGVKLCTIFPSRFGDANRRSKAAVDAGRFGRLTLGETTCKWWRPQAYYDEGGWKGTQALDGGGALMNQAIHNVDLLLWMMGPVTHVSGFTAMLAHERIEVEDTAVACLRFASGALGVIQATTSVHPGLPKTIAIHGDQGTVVIEQEDVLRWDFKPETAGGSGGRRQRFAQKVGASGGSSNPAAISHEGHARQLADFVQAIETDGTPLVDGREGRKAVEVIQAIYRSAADGA